MDTKQLITIVITAVITAFARVVVEAITSLIKKIAARLAKHPIAARPKDWQIIEVAMDIWMIGSVSLGLFHFGSSEEPIRRMEVLMAIFWTCMILFWGNKLLGDLLKYLKSRKKTEPNQALQTMTIADTSAAAHPPRQL